MAPLLQVSGLSVRFRTPYGIVRALSDVQLTIHSGELLVVVGESGSGKTVLADTIFRLLPLNSEVRGSVRLDGKELLTLSPDAMRSVRSRSLALIPQSPGTALNPVRRIGTLLLEVARARGLSAKEGEEGLARGLDEVGLGWDSISRMYAHQLSGGMQQRVVNALAFVGTPDLVIADEPTSGLEDDLVDATVAQLKRIRGRGAAILVITHDLRFAQKLDGQIGLMYASYLVESAPSGIFFALPAHPYGRGLLQALPEHGGIPIPGSPVELTVLPSCCVFAERCSVRKPRCFRESPPMYPVDGDNHRARCVLYAESERNQ